MRFYGGTVGCAGCGQVPPPLIGAALLPSAGNVTWLDGNGLSLIWCPGDFSWNVVFGRKFRSGVWGLYERIRNWNRRKRWRNE